MRLISSLNIASLITAIAMGLFTTSVSYGPNEPQPAMPFISTANLFWAVPIYLTILIPLALVIGIPTSYALRRVKVLRVPIIIIIGVIVGVLAGFLLEIPGFAIRLGAAGALFGLVSGLLAPSAKALNSDSAKSASPVS